MSRDEVEALLQDALARWHGAYGTDPRTVQAALYDAIEPLLQAAQISPAPEV